MEECTTLSCANKGPRKKQEIDEKICSLSEKGEDIYKLVVKNVSNAKPEDVDKALKSAKMGFDHWKKTTPWERSKVIRK